MNINYIAMCMYVCVLSVCIYCIVRKWVSFAVTINML